MTVMGLLGYLLRKFDFETAPIILGLVLAPMLEMSLRQSLAMSRGDYLIFVERPIAGTMLSVALVLLILGLKPLLRRGLDWRARLGLSERAE